jgi:hypothetical protein
MLASTTILLPTLEGCTTSGTAAQYSPMSPLAAIQPPTYGGALINVQDSNPILTNVIMWGNSATNNPEIYNDDATNPYHCLQ